MQHQDFIETFLALCDEEDLIVETHKTFYKVLKYIFKENLKIDDDLIVTLSKKFKPLIDFSYLSDLRKTYSTKVNNFEKHIEIMKKESLRFKIISNKVEELKATRTVEDLEKKISSIRLELITKMSNIDLKLQNSESFIDNYLGVLDKRWDKSFFYTTGFGNIDELMTVGLSPGNITIVAGRPGMGKSAFVGNMALRLSEKKVPVAFFSLEMSNVSVLDRLISLKSLVPINKLTKEIKNLNSVEIDQVKEKIEELKNNKYLFMSDFPRMSLSSISSQIEKWKKINNFETAVCIVDLFGQLIDIDLERTSFSYEFALREAKILSRELNIHFILVAQIRRKGENSKKIWSKRPTLEDLKHSGGFEEVASIVMLLFRAKYYNKSLDDDILEVNIAKQREGLAPVESYFIFNTDFTLIMPTTLKPYDKRISN